MYILSASQFQRAITGLWAMRGSKRINSGVSQVRPLTHSLAWKAHSTPDVPRAPTTSYYLYYGHCTEVDQVMPLDSLMAQPVEGKHGAYLRVCPSLFYFSGRAKRVARRATDLTASQASNRPNGELNERPLAFAKRPTLPRARRSRPLLSHASEASELSHRERGDRDPPIPRGRCERLA